MTPGADACEDRAMVIDILIFDEVDLLDGGGPYEVFLTASRLSVRDGEPAPFEVLTIGLDHAPVTTRRGGATRRAG